MGNRSRYRKLPDLFVTGKEIVFDDADGPVVMWMQALNPFEMQECRNAAQAARGRVAMAVKLVGTAEHTTAVGRFMGMEHDVAVAELADGKYTEWYLNAQNAIEVDPEWAERLTVLRASVEEEGTPRSPEEVTLVAQLNEQYIASITARIEEDRAFFVAGLDKLDDTELEQEFTDAWTERRAQNVAMAEFNLTEILYATRICEALPDDEGAFTRSSHDKCEHHKERVFETMEEVRNLPEEMQAVLRAAADGIAMTVRDAKNSDRQGSSSASSPLPSPEEESTPSTPEETSSEPLGTSPSPSATP